MTDYINLIHTLQYSVDGGYATAAEGDSLIAIRAMKTEIERLEEKYLVEGGMRRLATGERDAALERLAEIDKGPLGFQVRRAIKAEDALKAALAEIEKQSNRVVAVGSVAINSVPREDYQGAIKAIKEVNDLNVKLIEQRDQALARLAEIEKEQDENAQRALEISKENDAFRLCLLALETQKPAYWVSPGDRLYKTRAMAISNCEQLVTPLYAAAGASPEPSALQAENAKLITTLAACRDAFPVPDAGSRLDDWYCTAMADPLQVPEYVKACVGASPVQPSQAGELGAKAKVLREFLKQASYLKHPQVAYFGTIEGDSEEAWELRLYEAAIAAIAAQGGGE